MDKEKKGIVIASIVGLAVGFVAGWSLKPPESGSQLALQEENPAALPSVPAATQLASPAALDLSGNLQVVAGNQRAAESVWVDRAVLEQESWLTVREYTGGKLGGILGAKRLPAGTHQAVVIELLAPTEPGKNYIIAVYLDNGDMLFDHRTDRPVQKDNQLWQASSFTAL